MAIDTAAKRRCVGGLPWPLGPGVTPDAAKPVGWRQQAGRGYSGIAAGAPPAAPGSAVQLSAVWPTVELTASFSEP